MLTTVVKTDCADMPLLSVRTDRPVDKDDLFVIIKAVKRIWVKGPIAPGQVIAENIAGTGANLIATWVLGKM